jgi:type VI secretion system protein ImpH
MEDRTVAPAAAAPAAAGTATSYGPAPGAPGAPSAASNAPGAPLPSEAPQPVLEMLLRDEPTSFDFFQAVRLLQRLRPGREPVGRFRQPAAEVARFGANLATVFPASEIQALTLPPDEPGAGGLPQMTVNFMGLTGPLGVLPSVYTRHVAERVRGRDTALRDFLDLFHHRIISLFYRAWEKYRFTVVRERDEVDPVSAHLRDLIGVGTPGLEGRLPLPDEALLFYSGLLGMQPRSAQALEQMIADYFEVPVSVQQFVGAWYPLTVPSQCRLGDDVGPAGQLGLGAVAGDEVWDVQSRVRLRLGPIPRHRYDRFLPGGSAHGPLRALVRFFSDDQFEFDVQLVLARDDVPGCVLGEDGATAPPLGWCTWLRSAPFSRDPDDTVLDL